MRIVVMGTGPFAVPSAEKIRELSHEIALVVTKPLVESAGKRPSAPMLDWAIDHQLPLFQPASINAPDSLQRLRAADAELFFVCDYGQILSHECLACSGMGGINLHGSLLPKHRGAAPVQWSLLAGDRETGVSVIHMTPKLDGGPILATATTPILPDENAAQLEARLAQLGVQATCQAIQILQSWDGVSGIGVPQHAALITKAPRFSKSDGQLDFRLPADVLARLVRALQPWPGTFADLKMGNAKPIRLLIRAARDLDCDLKSISHDIGSVWATSAKQLHLDWPEAGQRLLAVQCSGSLLLVNRLQPAGKREMSADEFLRGHGASENQSFVLSETPSRFAQLFGIHSV